MNQDEYNKMKSLSDARREEFVEKNIGRAGRTVGAIGTGAEKLSDAMGGRSERLKQFGNLASRTGKQLNAPGVAGKLSAQAREMAQTIKPLTSPMGAISLMRHINFSVDWLLAAALAAALLKDILDWIGFSLPGINEVMNFCVGITIAFALLLMGSGVKRSMVKKQVRKWLVLLGGVGCEEFFGLNLAPIETITVLVCYYLVLIDRKEAAEEARERQQAQAEAEYG
jgi:hypothetical protein